MLSRARHVICIIIIISCLFVLSRGICQNIRFARRLCKIKKICQNGTECVVNSMTCEVRCQCPEGSTSARCVNTTGETGRVNGPTTGEAVKSTDEFMRSSLKYTICRGRYLRCYHGRCHRRWSICRCDPGWIGIACNIRCDRNCGSGQCIIINGKQRCNCPFTGQILTENCTPVRRMITIGETTVGITQEWGHTTVRSGSMREDKATGFTKESIVVIAILGAIASAFAIFVIVVYMKQKKLSRYVVKLQRDYKITNFAVAACNTPTCKIQAETS